MEGREFDPKLMHVEAKGTFTSFVLRGYSYTDVKVNGIFDKMAFDGNLSVNDQNLGLTFKGENGFFAKIPEFNFSAAIAHANLQALGF